jgi:UPF0755 protein
MAMKSSLQTNAQGITSLLTKKPMGRLALSAVFIFFLTLSLRSCANGIESAPAFAPGEATGEVRIEVANGETGSEIARKLEAAGVVKSSLAFFRVAVADERSSRIAPGEHLIERSIPAKEALEQLLDPKRIPNLIIVRDGTRISEVVESLIDFGLSEVDVARAMKSAAPPEIFKTRSIEGFLYPAQYSFNKDIDAKRVIAAMLEKFEWATKNIEWSNSSELSPFEILTVASLVETEGTPDVFGKVSRVIYNRLEKRMPLQFDSTVHYALNRRGEIRVSLEDIKVRSKYNTFIYPGLPPGPIGSPTVSAIKAALQPEAGDWIYFVTVKPNDTRFTSSYDQFLEWKAEYKKNFKLGLFE